MPISTQDSTFMGREPISKLLIKFATPAIISCTINCAYNIVDRLYIGRGIGAAAQAGMALTFPIMVILIAFGVLIGVGSAATVSILLGEKKQEQAEMVLGQAFALFCLFILTFQTLSLLFLDKILFWFGGTAQAIPYAKTYLSIILWGNIFQHISFGLSNVIRAEGNAQKSMYIILLGACLNIVLDPIFIFTFKMGIAGAAYATVISMICSSLWVMIHFCCGQGVLRFRLKYVRIYPKLFRKVVAIGIAPCLVQTAQCGIAVLFNHCFKHFAADETEATIAIGAFGIQNSIFLFMLMPSFGIMQGTQPILGYNWGAKLYDRVRASYSLAFNLSAGISLVIAIVMFFFARPFVVCFSKDAALTDMTVYAIRLSSAGFTFVAFGLQTTSYFQSIGRAGIAVLMSMSRQIIFLAPCIVFMPMFLGFNGIWYSWPVSDIIAGIIAIAIYFHECRKLKRLAKETQLQ